MARPEAIGFADLDEAEVLRAVALPEGLECNPAALSAEFVKQPGDASRWRWLRGEALGELERQKVRVKALEAALDRTMARARLRIKSGLTPSGAGFVDKAGRRVNTEDIEALICGDDEVVRAADAITAALETRALLEERLEKIKGAVEGFSDKKDMLISLGAQVRAEMDHDPSIRARR